MITKYDMRDLEGGILCNNVSILYYRQKMFLAAVMLLSAWENQTLQRVLQITPSTMKTSTPKTLP